MIYLTSISVIVHPSNYDQDAIKTALWEMQNEVQERVKEKTLQETMSDQS
jgi:hypothetical protein